MVSNGTNETLENGPMLNALLIDFGLAQIYPMADEETGAEPKIVSTSFCDPYLLVIRDDGSLLVLEADGSGDLDIVTQNAAPSSHKWLTGSLYRDREAVFASQESSSDHNSTTNILMFLLSEKGTLQVRRPLFAFADFMQLVT